MLKLIYATFFKKLSFLTSLSIKITRLTGKSDKDIHPKFLIKRKKPWYVRYIKNRDKVLDFGCGEGKNLTTYIKKASKVFAFDVSKESVEKINSRIEQSLNNRLRVIVHDGNKKLPYENDKFNVVIMTDVLEHLIRRKFALQQVKRVLKKNGYLLLSCDNPDTSWKKLQKSLGMFYYADQDHNYEYPKDEILSTLKSLGFKVEKVDPITFDTPFKPLIDLIGSISLSLYEYLNGLRVKKAMQNPSESTGYNICSKLIGK